jgi:hypothetical protein
MKKIELTQNKYTLVDDEDYNRLNKLNWHILNKGNTFYAKRNATIKYNFIYMHRMIMNPKINMYVDHINKNGLDNRKENLRICTNYQNLWNSKLYKSNTSGYKGVYWCKHYNKWHTRIKVCGKQKHIGYFKDIIEAKEAYIKAAKQYFGEFYSIVKENKYT